MTKNLKDGEKVNRYHNCILNRNFKKFSYLIYQKFPKLKNCQITRYFKILWLSLTYIDD